MLSSTTTVMVEESTARRILASRELARRHLVDYQTYMRKKYLPSKHHWLVGGYLEQVAEYIRTKGKSGIGRLLIMEPPRHGKSEQASIGFPGWLLGNNPDLRIIVTSYGLDLAADFSKKVREDVASEKYANLFGQRSSTEDAVELSTDSRSMKAWDLAAPHRGGMIASGVGGGITGKGADLLIVDDPFKNRAEADSPDHRDSVWEWWTSTAYTRLEDGGAVVGSLTHWNADDWAGRLIKMMTNDPKSDQWTVVCLPAIWEVEEIPNGKTFAEWQRMQALNGVWVTETDMLDRQVGEALWSEKYDEVVLERIKTNVGSYEWEALYQQRPYARKGGMFKREWFGIVDKAPDQVRMRVRYWDKAGTQDDGAYTAGVCMSLGVDGNYYVEHVVRGQWSTFKREETMLRTAKLDKETRPGRTVIWHPQDPASGGKDSARYTNVPLAEAGFEAHFEPVTDSKEGKAGPWSSICEAGKVYLVRGGWNEAFIEEHIPFPTGKYKDQVDAAACAFSKVRQDMVCDPSGMVDFA